MADHRSHNEPNRYHLKATGEMPSELPILVAYIADRKGIKDLMWKKRHDKLVSMAAKLDKLISVYQENSDKDAKNPKETSLFYKAALAHQIYNTLLGSKLNPDFIDYTPLGSEFNEELIQKSKDLTKAHRLVRYKGDFDQAKKDAKPDLVWGNSFIEMSTRYETRKDAKGKKEELPICTEYTHAPFREIRNFYGDTDMMRIIDFSIHKYVETYGEGMLKKVTLGDIVATRENNQQNEREREYDMVKDIIQVVRYYDPARLLFVEIHGGNGYIFKHFEEDQYPFIWKDGKGYAPFLESRFYEQTTGDYFGWGVMDYVIDLAILETTITNATAMNAVWDAGAPSFIFTNDPDDMKTQLARHWKNLNRGLNNPIVQKDTGIGTRGKVETLKKGVDNRNMEIWDEVTTSRATRFAGVDVRGLSDFAPTAEQQKLQKIEADKMNVRVLLTNEQREKTFAVQEMAFLQNGKTEFHKYEIETIDSVSEDFKTADGFMPPLMKKIGDILKGVEDVELQIVPRMEGVLDDMTFLEIQSMQEDFALVIPGTEAHNIMLEKYFAKKNPNLGLKRGDFVTPAAPEPEGVEPLTATEAQSPAGALTAQL